MNEIVPMRVETTPSKFLPFPASAGESRSWSISYSDVDPLDRAITKRPNTFPWMELAKSGVAVTNTVGDLVCALASSAHTLDRNSLSYDQTVMAWFAQSEARLNELMRLQENWDSYGSPPVSRTAIHWAKNFLRELQSVIHLGPTIVPISGGGLQLEWHLVSNELEIEIDPMTTVIGCMKSEEDGSYREDTFWAADIEVLINVARAAITGHRLQARHPHEWYALAQD